MALSKEVDAVFKFWTLKTVKKYLSLCLIAAMCINIIMCTFDSAKVLAEDNFMASIVSAADKDNKISVIFSSEPENTADWSQIKVLDSYGNDVFNGNCEISLKTLNVNLSEELNSQMEYALILPRTLCNVNGTLIKDSVLYFEPYSESKEDEVPNVKYYNGDGTFDLNSEAVDSGDSEHGKVIKAVNNGTDAEMKRIIGSVATDNVIPFWDCSELNQTVFSMDIYLSNVAHNFNYRIYNELDVMIGYFFFDKGGNFVVAKGSTNMWSGEDKDNINDYPDNVIGAAANVENNKWNTITILFDKKNNVFNYWINDIFVGSARFPTSSDGSYGKQIKEVRIENNGPSTDKQGYVLIDNVKSGNAMTSPQIDEVITNLTDDKANAILSENSDLFESNIGVDIPINASQTTDKEYIVQYDILSDIGADGGVRALVRSEGAVLGGCYQNVYNDVYVRNRGDWFPVDNREYYNTNITSGTRNYQTLYNVIKSGKANTYTHLINPKTKLVKTWIDGHYIGQSKPNGDDVSCTKLTIKTHSKDDKITLKNIKVGYPKNSIPNAYVKKIKLCTDTADYGIYSDDLNEAPTRMDIYFSKQIVPQLLGSKSVKILDEQKKIVKTEVLNYSSDEMKLIVRISDKMQKCKRYTIEINGIVTVDGGVIANYKNYVSLGVPQIGISVFNSDFEKEGCVLNTNGGQQSVTLNTGFEKMDIEKDKLIFNVTFSGNITSLFKITTGDGDGSKSVVSFVDNFKNAVLSNTRTDECTPQENYNDNFVCAENSISANKRQTLTYVFDKENNHISMFVDKKYIGGVDNTYRDFYIPKEIYLSLSGENACVNIENVSLGYESNDEQWLNIITGRNGNIYYECADISYRLDAQSTGGKETEFYVKTRVLEKDGTAIYESEEYLKANRIGRLKDERRNINLNKAKKQYGNFMLKVELIDSDNNIILNAETEFSSVLPSEPNSYTGISNHFSTGSDNAEKGMKISAKSGFGISRDEIRWQDIEGRQGEYKLTEPNKKWLDECLKNNVEPYVIIDGNSVYLDEYPPKDKTLTNYGELAYWIADNTREYTNKYEIWNEYNVYSENDITDSEYATPQNYAELLKASYSQIHSGNENAVVYGMCATYTGGTKLSDWIDSVLSSLNGEKYMDAVSIHIYYAGSQPETSGYLKIFNDVRAVLDKYPNYKNMPILISETGWHSSSMYENTELRQAKYAVRSAALLSDKAERFIWYKLVETINNEKEAENKFGLLKAEESEMPYAAKPAFVALSCFNALIGDSALTTTETNNGMYCYKYINRNGDITYMLWSEDNKSGTYQLSTGEEGDCAYVYDMYGNRQIAEKADGRFNLSITEEPIYLRVCKSKIILKNNKGGEIKYLDDVNNDSDINVTVELNKSDFDNDKVMLIYAWYKENMLKQTECVEIKNVNNIYTEKIKKVSDAAELSVFLWDGFATMRPVGCVKIK